MIVEHNFYVGVRDMNYSKELTNTALLSYLEDVACMHSEIAGYGINDMPKTQRTWVLLSWKIEVKKRPKFNDTLNVKTWSRKIDKFYAFRDFEIFNQNNESIAIATSKWVFIDIEKGKLIKVDDEVASKYQTENISVFEEELSKFKEPDEYTNKIEYKITKNMIDINNHLNNIYYIDIAKECIPEKAENFKEPNKFEVIYKKEVKLGETVIALYSKTDEFEYVTIKSQDGEIVHSIIRFSN